MKKGTVITLDEEEREAITAVCNLLMCLRGGSYVSGRGDEIDRARINTAFELLCDLIMAAKLTKLV